MVVFPYRNRFYHLQPLAPSLLGAQHHTDGGWRQIALRPDLWITMLELPGDQTARLYYHKQPAMIDFGFILSGHLNHRLQGDVTDGRIEAGGGFAGIGFFPDRKGVVKIAGHRSVQVLHIHISPQRLHAMVREDLSAMPPAFRNVVAGSAGNDYLSAGKMDPATRAVALDIFNARPGRLPQKLLLECKALELITLQLGRLMSAETDRQVHIHLTGSEKKRIRAAHDRLLRDLSEPPSLGDLGRRFCLNRNKLQYGFRALFGHSVFGCLREHKMQKARHLLETAEMNVSQVAWEVGYVNVSQFSKAYKKRFGVLPKQYQRSILNKCG